MTPACGVPVLVASLFIAAASAQPVAGNLSLAGQVVNTLTGEPVNRALVKIVRYANAEPRVPGERPRAPSEPLTSSTLTGASGRFRFEALARGTYSVSVQKPQFVPGDDVPPPLELTTSVGDLRLKLSPLGVIEGKVVDQNGDPLRGVNIVVLSSRIVNGFRQTDTDRDVATDDRGMYRLWNMRPGKYFVKAAGWSGGTYLYTGDKPPQLFADETFAPAYFGGGRSLDSATAIRIEAATQAHADFSIKPEPAFKIRGSLGNFASGHTAKFELLSGDEDVSAGRVTLNRDTGRFEVQYVASGSYVLRAIQDQTSAESPVEVSGADVGGLELSLAGGVDVKGLVRITNSEPADTSSGGPTRRGAESICTARLHPARARSGETYYSAPGDPGEFTLSGVMPGIYRVAARCFGGYVESVFSGTQDLLANPLLTVPPGAPPTIEIVAKRGGGTIHGQFRSDVTPKGHGITVLLVPQFSGSTGPVPVQAPEKQGSERVFQFSMGNLAPGAYVAYAFVNGEDIEYGNPAFLRSLSGGVSVQVEDGSDKEIGITEAIR